MLEFARPGVGRHRHDGDAGDQSADDGEDRLDGRLRQNRDGSRSRYPFGDGGGGADQILAGQVIVADADDFGIIRGCGGQRRQQHFSRVPCRGPVSAEALSARVVTRRGRVARRVP